MIRVSIFYPNKAGSRFDLDYYLKHHMPMAIKAFGDALRGAIVEQGLNGGGPEAPPPFSAICHLHFDSVEAFQSAFAGHGAELQADIANYTDVEPVIQIGEVKLSQ